MRNHCDEYIPCPNPYCVDGVVEFDTFERTGWDREYIGTDTEPCELCLGEGEVENPDYDEDHASCLEDALGVHPRVAVLAFFLLLSVFALEHRVVIEALMGSEIAAATVVVVRTGRRTRRDALDCMEVQP